MAFCQLGTKFEPMQLLKKIWHPVIRRGKNDLNTAQNWITFQNLRTNSKKPTKQYTKSQNKYAPETKQLKIKGVKYPN